MPRSSARRAAARSARPAGAATPPRRWSPWSLAAHATLAVSDVLISNNCPHRQVQVKWVQVYPPDQYTALSARLSRQGCGDRSLITMHVSTVISGP
ncbi:MAG TPA: hypothetical protein VGH53_15045 [Streptosporangiaceae bacterium]